MIKVPNNNFSCFCGTIHSILDENSLKIHIIHCKEYIKNSPFADLFYNSDLTKLSLPELKTLKYEFEHYLSILDEELNDKIEQKLPEPIPPIALRKGFSLNIDLRTEIKLKKFGSIYHNFDDNATTVSGLTNLSNSLFKCLKCRKFFFDDESNKRFSLEGCGHTFCKACSNKTIDSQFLKNNGQVKCLFEECNSSFSENDFKKLLSVEKFNKLNEEMLEKMLNIISCMKCKEKFEFVRGKPDPHMKDNMGKPLSLTLALHFAENRFICPKCKTEQCKNCHNAPFHLGYSCDAWKKKQISPLCTFCESPLDPSSSSDLPICSSEECKTKASSTCLSILPCSHHCKGYSKESIHLPCLKESCFEANSAVLLDQHGSDYCNICFVESLAGSSCYQLGCGHIFHLNCLETRVKLRWLKPRMIFNFCLCPLCKIWMVFPQEHPLALLMSANLQQFELVKSKAFDRLKYEGQDKSARLSNPSDPFFQKPLEYALAIYSYYECFKCKTPYFGGLKSCEDALEHHGNEKPYKPEELVCAKCCDIPLENCVKHGSEYIEFKCKYCCALALWFCWGTTHFCDPCHERINAGDDLTQYPMEKHPKCPGKELCPLKTDHQPNGEESALGCSMCRNYKEEAKDF